MRVCVLCVCCFALPTCACGAAVRIRCGWVGGWWAFRSFLRSLVRLFLRSFVRSLVVFVRLCLCCWICVLFCIVVSFVEWFGSDPCTHARTHAHSLARSLARSHHVCIMSGGRGGGDVMSFVPSFLPACLSLGRPCCLHAVRSLTHWLSCTRLLVRSFVPCSFLRSCVRSRLLTRAARGSCELSLSLALLPLALSLSLSLSACLLRARCGAAARRFFFSVDARLLGSRLLHVGKGGIAGRLQRGHATFNGLAWLGLAWLSVTPGSPKPTQPIATGKRMLRCLLSLVVEWTTSLPAFVYSVCHSLPRGCADVGGGWITQKVTTSSTD